MKSLVKFFKPVNDHCVTPKVNFRFAIEKTTYRRVGNITDQTVEALHSALNKLNYWIKDIISEKHEHKLYWGIRHFNSYNV